MRRAFYVDVGEDQHPKPSLIDFQRQNRALAVSGGLLPVPDRLNLKKTRPFDGLHFDGAAFRIGVVLNQMPRYGEVSLGHLFHEAFSSFARTKIAVVPAIDIDGEFVSTFPKLLRATHLVRAYLTNRKTARVIVGVGVEDTANPCLNDSDDAMVEDGPATERPAIVDQQWHFKGAGRVPACRRARGRQGLVASAPRCSSVEARRFDSVA